MFRAMKRKTPTEKDWGTFGGRMRWARHYADKTQKEAAKAVGIAQPTLSELEGDDSIGSAHTIGFAICYGVSAEWLATGAGKPNRKPHTRLEEKITRLKPTRRALLESLVDDWIAEDED